MGTLADAQSPQPAAKVNAEGNITQLTGPLRFNPASVSVAVGDRVEWVNTDVLVPHTATEDHGLWNLTGTYGQTPANPAGFGPGATRTRRFAAGSWSYFCEVHPVQMHGTVLVPDRLSSQPIRRKRKHKRKRVRRFRVVAVWAAESLPRGQVFDVQAKRGEGDWKTVMDGTTDQSGAFPAGPAGTTWSFRSRVRADDQPARASGYSPVATITVG
ncbi:MAG: plastocyanin/azurin family copper-binding protein [Solirubrobacterales bacterium]